MHDSISENAEFNFNYVCLLIVASIVAALGLMTNSSTTVISSMLLSPIMGPVIGMSYGLVIWDIDLIKKSAKVELISISGWRPFSVDNIFSPSASIKLNLVAAIRVLSTVLLYHHHGNPTESSRSIRH